MKKSSEKAKPKTKKVRFNLYAPGTETVSLAGDLNVCVLVHSRSLRDARAQHALPQGGLPE
ncbi:MAG: hypothetical protein ABSH06_25000 [Thermodesulfobacteriota bacterium]